MANKHRYATDTDPKAVIRAIKLYNQLRPERFYRRFGFAPATNII